VVPTQTHNGAINHIKLANIYLRQVGLVLVPDDSAAVPTDPGNNVAGLSRLDGRIVRVTRPAAGFASYWGLLFS